MLDHECARLGIEVHQYLDRYDERAAQPFDGVIEVLARLERWAVCSNKHARSGTAELARLGWSPEVAMFADAFGGPKHLGPVIDALGVSVDEVVFVGDTAHDRQAARAVGARFAIATWNPRATAEPGDVVLREPSDVLGLLQLG